MVSHFIEFSSQSLFELCRKANEFSRENALVRHRLLVLIVHHAASLGEPKQLYGVFDKFSLDLFVQRRVTGEAWTVVDFEQLRLALVIEHDVKSQDLETHRILVVIELAGAEHML